MQNIQEIEHIILGSCLEQPKLMNHFTGVKPEFFSNFMHSELWRIMLSWHYEKKTIYPPTLLPFITHLFAGEDRAEQASSFMTHLLGHSFPLRPKDIDDYSSLMAKTHLSRATLNILRSYQQSITASDDILVTLDNLQNDLFQLRTEARTGSDVESIGKLAEDALRALESRIDGTAPKGMSTGFKAIDKACGGGLHKGGLVMIGGATGMGKTIPLAVLLLT